MLLHEDHVIFVKASRLDLTKEERGQSRQGSELSTSGNKMVDSLSLAPVLLLLVVPLPVSLPLPTLVTLPLSRLSLTSGVRLGLRLGLGLLGGVRLAGSLAVRGSVWLAGLVGGGDVVLFVLGGGLASGLWLVLGVLGVVGCGIVTVLGLASGSNRLLLLVVLVVAPVVVTPALVVVVAWEGGCEAGEEERSSNEGLHDCSVISVWVWRSEGIFDELSVW